MHRSSGSQILTCDGKRSNGTILRDHRHSAALAAQSGWSTSRSYTPPPPHVEYPGKCNIFFCRDVVCRVRPLCFGKGQKFKVAVVMPTQPVMSELCHSRWDMYALFCGADSARKYPFLCCRKDRTKKNTSKLPLAHIPPRDMNCHVMSRHVKIIICDLTTVSLCLSA